MALNALQRFGSFLFNIPREREVLKDVKVVEENRELRAELLNTRGQLGRLRTHIKHKERQKEDSDSKKTISEKLLQEGEQIEKEEMGEFVSLNGFFAKLFGVDSKKRSKWGIKMEMADRNGEVAHPYGDMGFTTKGHFIIKDKEGNIINMAYFPRKLFKLEGIKSQLKRGLIFMNVDKEGEYLPEVEQIEIPDQIYDEDAHIFKETEELKVKAIDLIRDKDMENRALRATIEQLELSFGDIIREQNQIKAQLLILAKTNNITKADFSDMIDKVVELSKLSYSASQKIVNLSETNALQEENITSLNSQNDKLRQKAEVVGSNTTFENAKGIYEDVADSITARKPEQK